jgi:hypothetical protein
MSLPDAFMRPWDMTATARTAVAVPQAAAAPMSVSEFMTSSPPPRVPNTSGVPAAGDGSAGAGGTSIENATPAGAESPVLADLFISMEREMGGPAARAAWNQMMAPTTVSATAGPTAAPVLDEVPRGLSAATADTAAGSAAPAHPVADEGVTAASPAYPHDPAAPPAPDATALDMVSAVAIVSTDAFRSGSAGSAAVSTEDVAVQAVDSALPAGAGQPTHARGDTVGRHIKAAASAAHPEPVSEGDGYVLASATVASAATSDGGSASTDEHAAPQPDGGRPVDGPVPMIDAMPAVPTTVPAPAVAAPTAASVTPATQPAGSRPSPMLEARATYAAHSVSGTAPASGGTVDQVASALALQVKDGRGEATITLRPAALGEIKARITTGTDGVVIRLSAEHDAVGELLRSRIGELRDALAGHQVAVSELHVLHNAPQATGLPANDDTAWRDRPWQREDNGDEPSGRQTPGRDDDDTQDE